MGGLFEEDANGDLQPITATGVVDLWWEEDADGNVMPRTTVLVKPGAPTIAGIVLSATSFRVTFSSSHAADVTNIVYYAVVAGGAMTWASGGTRTGDGTVDVTGVTAGATVYVVGYSYYDVNYFSIPSNVLGPTKLQGNFVGGLGELGEPVLIKQRGWLKDKTREIILYRWYALGVDRDLADADLEPGDSLPEDSGTEIFRARLEKLKPKGWGTAVEVAKVWARKLKAWED